MYNKFLEYMLDDRPEKALSKHGIIIRKAISPLVRLFIPLITKTKIKVVRRAELPNDKPIIFAASHGFRDDVVYSFYTARRHVYVLLGNIPQIMNSFDGFTAWLNGAILVDRMDKHSRIVSKEKMIAAINHGANILIFPEGCWNKSQNDLISKMFPGVYDIAEETGAYVAPVVTHLEGNTVYSILGEAFDIRQYDKTQGMIILRDKMAGMKYELIEKHSQFSRAALGSCDESQQYWEDYLEKLISEVKFYDYEIEANSAFVDKNISSVEDVFSHLNTVVPDNRNAFLFNKRNHF